jgi:CRISPR system Cascade subunit CasC
MTTTPATAPATAQRIDTSTDLIDTTTVAGKFVGIHVLRPVIAVNLNANQDGTPKTLTLNDSTRLRVSSQARKRAMRQWTHTFINNDEQAARTRNLPARAAEILEATHSVDYNDALNTVDALILGCGKFSITPRTPERTEEIAFVPRRTAALLAQIADRHYDDLAPLAAILADDRAAADAEATPAKGRGRVKKSEKKYLTLGDNTLPAIIRKQVVDAFAPGANSEIALNGRMLTALPADGAIEAAGSVAHSYSVDPVAWTRDEWTATDDWQDGQYDSSDTTGAAMLDTRTLASGTLYEWAALDRNQLRINLADTSGLTGDALDEAVRSAEQMYVSSAAWAVPTASSHTTGSIAPPTLVIAAVTDTPPLTPPVFTDAVIDNVPTTAAHRLADYLTLTHRRRPINGGTVIWLPPTPTPAPTFPTTLTIED